MSERSQIAVGIIANEIDAAKELLSGGRMDREALAAAVKEEAAERVQACAAALRELLDAHACTLLAMVGVTGDGRLVGEVQLRAK